MAHVEELSAEACLGLLARERVGRLALVDDDGPVVVPVNYALDGRDVVLRSDAGTKVDLAAGGTAAAFEIDGVDHTRRLGFSVVLRGTLRRVDDEAEGARLAALVDEPYVGGPAPHLLRLSTRVISGRRIAVPPDVPGDRLDAVARGNVWLGRDGDDLLA